MIPVHRGTATSRRTFPQGKKNSRTNEPRVTGAVCALSAGGERTLVRKSATFTTQLLVRKIETMLKMPPATLRAHIAMVTSSSTAPNLEHSSELRLPKLSLLATTSLVPFTFTAPV